MKRFVTIILAALLLLTGATSAYAEESTAAATMRLEKTEGTVHLCNQNGTTLPARTDSKLYNGYQLNTKLASYAYIGLDDKKAIKLDESSAASVKKSGKKLEILVSEGQLFFHVKEKLQSDETMEIRTSNMVTGIRGTAGVVNNVDAYTTEFYLFDGTVTMNYVDAATGTIKEISISAGESAVITQVAAADGSAAANVQTSKLTEDQINGFAAVEIAKDEALQNKIAEQTTLNVQLITDTADQKLAQEQTAHKQQQIEAEQQIANRDQPKTDSGNDSSSSGSSSGGGSIGVPVTYSVRFETNGGSTVTAQNVREGASATKPEDPVLQRFTFQGWYADADFTIPFDFNKGITGSTVVYAKWQFSGGGVIIPETHSVRFETNGGSVVATQDVREGSFATQPEDPVLEDFIFLGWYANDDFSTPFNFDAVITGSTVVYAKWQFAGGGVIIPETYSVRFETNGGSVVATQVVRAGSLATQPEDPVRDDDIFLGWYADAECTVPFSFDTAIMGVTTIYAKFEPIPPEEADPDATEPSLPPSQPTADGDPMEAPTDPMEAPTDPSEEESAAEDLLNQEDEVTQHDSDPA